MFRDNIVRYNINLRAVNIAEYYLVEKLFILIVVILLSSSESKHALKQSLIEAGVK